MSSPEVFVKADTLSGKQISLFFLMFYVLAGLTIGCSIFFLPSMMEELRFECPETEINPEYDEFCQNSLIANDSKWSGAVNGISGLNQFLTIAIQPSIASNYLLENGRSTLFTF